LASCGLRKDPLRAVLFDFGGVLAEDGFQEGLRAIASRSGLEPEAFFRLAEDLIYETGYVLGRCAEADYWAALRERTGVTGSDGQLRAEILGRFTLRPAVLEEAKRTRAQGISTAILSDQTNWLDEVEARTPFYRHFDFVFNSYRMKKGKRDPSVFGDVLSAMGLRPGEALFVDDKEGNVRRAAEIGLEALRFKDAADLRKRISRRLGGAE
jgi:putative hydrolase of the HAD superfamily